MLQLLCRQQLWFTSDPWPGKSICCGVAKRERKIEERKEGRKKARKKKKKERKRKKRVRTN